jgi:hypothetical protein
MRDIMKRMSMLIIVIVGIALVSRRAPKPAPPTVQPFATPAVAPEVADARSAAITPAPPREPVASAVRARENTLAPLLEAAQKRGDRAEAERLGKMLAYARSLTPREAE